MGRFLVVPGVVAVCGERLVVIIDIAPEGIVTVRDLATAQIYTTTLLRHRAGQLHGRRLKHQ